MAKIALVGITADPPTSAHAMLVEAAVGSKDEQGKKEYDKIWVMPCNEHKFGKKPTAIFHRMAMTSLMVSALRQDWGKRILLSDYEIAHNLDGAAWNTIQSLKQTHPGDEFHWVMGMDNANLIEKWQNSEELRRTVPFRIVERSGYPSIASWYSKPPHKLLPTYMSCPYSSSIFRERHRVGDKRCQAYVFQNVYDYIVATGLYSEEEQ
jgi:nicotinate (nicotinamide) nucleotide adenylyltransferase